MLTLPFPYPNDYTSCLGWLSKVFAVNAPTDYSYRDLKAVINRMKAHHITETGSYRLDYLEAVLAYRGRVYFSRCLSTCLESDTENGCTVNSVISPNSKAALKHMEIHFKLQSDDGKRQLVTTINVAAHHGLLIAGELTVTYRPRKYNMVDVAYYRVKNGQAIQSQRGMVRWHSPIHEAFRRQDYGDIEAVWKLMDAAWLDILARRPLVRPLTALNLKVRLDFHYGQWVKLFTPEGSLTGELIGIDQGKHGVQLIKLSQSAGVITVASSDIFELLPYRPKNTF